MTGCRLLHHDGVFARRQLRQIDTARAMADITKNDGILIVDINMHVMALGTQAHIKLQFVSCGTLQYRAV